MKVTAGILLTLFGILFIFAAFSNTSKAFFAAGWPATSATITSKSITESEAARASQNYSLNLNYSYEVHGKTYSGHRITFPDRTYPSRSAAESAATSWTIGKTVPVHYNPKNPSESALSPKPDYSFLTIFSVMGFSLLVSALLLFRRPKPPREPK